MFSERERTSDDMSVSLFSLSLSVSVASLSLSLSVSLTICLSLCVSLFHVSYPPLSPAPRHFPNRSAQEAADVQRPLWDSSSTYSRSLPSLRDAEDERGSEKKREREQECQRQSSLSRKLTVLFSFLLFAESLQSLSVSVSIFSFSAFLFFSSFSVMLLLYFSSLLFSIQVSSLSLSYLKVLMYGGSRSQVSVVMKHVHSGTTRS